MSQGQMYFTAADAFVGFAGNAYVWLLLNDLAHFDATHATLADVAADELAVAGYARVDLTGAAQVDVAGSFTGRAYGSDNASFAGLAPGGTVGALVLAVKGPNDAASPLVGYWACWLDTADTPLGFGLPAWEYGGLPLPGSAAHLLHLHYMAMS
jgi:hypothetical protein